MSDLAESFNLTILVFAETRLIARPGFNTTVEGRHVMVVPHTSFAHTIFLERRELDECKIEGTEIVADARVSHCL